MKFFQRGRGQTQSNTRAERDTQLVLLDRIDALNRTIGDLSTQLQNISRDEPLRIRIGLERRYINAVRERDDAIKRLMNAPLDDTRSFGKNAPAAGGGSKVLTEFAKQSIKSLEKNGAIIYNKYYGKEAVKEAEYVFFHSGDCCSDLEKNNTAARKWNSDWTPSEIDNAVYFTYAIMAKDNSHYMKHARLIIGNSDLDVSIGIAHHGIRKGRRTRKRKKRDSIGKKDARTSGDRQCKKLTGKKYRTRSSPSYSAQDCPNMKKKGNDGNYYISTQNKSKIYTWKKL